jgi:uncharacterized protein YjbI with pentapeptide repeats
MIREIDILPAVATDSHHNGHKRKEIKAGRADALKITFRPDQPAHQRTIEASRIEDFVRKFDGVVDAPIEISNAIIKGNLHVQHAHFKCGLSVTGSEFQGSVDFSFAVFDHSVNFYETCFMEGANFRGTHARGDFKIVLAYFDRPAYFDDADIDEVFRADGAVFNQVSFRRLTCAKSFIFGPMYSGKEKYVGRRNGARFLIHPADQFVPARFRRRADFTDAQVKGPVHFEGAYFDDKAIFERVKFESAAYFCCYINCSGVDLARLRRREVKLIRTQFRAESDFTGARISGTACFTGVYFKKKATFNRILIDGNGLFNPVSLAAQDGEIFIPVCFGGEASFWSADIKGSANFDGAQFKAAADFERFGTGARAFFRAATFNKLLIPTRFNQVAVFRDAQIGGAALFEGTQFKKDAVFQHLHTGAGALFRAVENRETGQITAVLFGGEANFFTSHIHSNAEFDGAQFKGEANFERIEIGGNAYFRPMKPGSDPVCFHLKAKFIGAVIKGTAHFSGALFKGITQFTNAQFHGDAYFDNRHHYEDNPLADFNDPTKVIKPVKFCGSVNFNGSLFRSHLYLQEADFAMSADFRGVKVEGTATFLKVLFCGDTSFRDAQFIALIFCEPADLGKQAQFPCGKVDLSGLTYQRIDVDLHDLLGGIDTMPSPSPIITLRIGHVRSDKERDQLSALTEYNSEHPFYDRQPYSQLINVYRSTGHETLADKVYLIQRARERKLRWYIIKKCFNNTDKSARDVTPKTGDASGRTRYQPILNLDGIGITGNSNKRYNRLEGIKRLPFYLFDLLHWGLSDYGVRPVRLLLICLFWILLGAGLFYQEGAVALEKDSREVAQATSKPTTNRAEEKLESFSQAMGVSVNRFIPLIKSPSGSKWKPTEKLIPYVNCRVFSYSAYGTMHGIAGAILIPLIVAAIARMLYHQGSNK